MQTYKPPPFQHNSKLSRHLHRFNIIPDHLGTLTPPSLVQSTNSEVNYSQINAFPILVVVVQEGFTSSIINKSY